MASSSFSLAADVHSALQRTKRKIRELQLSSADTRSEVPQETTSPTWPPSKELKDSLVDMYSANPKVNEELRQRLPSPVRTVIGLSVDHREETLSSRPVSPLRRYGSPSSPSSIFPAPHHSPPSPLRLSSTSRSPSPPRSIHLSPPPPPVLLLPPPVPRLRSSPVAGMLKFDVSASRGTSPSPSTSPHRDTDGGSPAAMKPAPGLQSADHSSSGRQALDWGKNISFLLKEVDALRDANHRLQGQLLQKEEVLQRRRVDEELKEESREVPTALLEEVLAAQKDRDQALMSRLLLANEERDAALLRIRRIQQAEHLEASTQVADMEVEQLLQRVCEADSAQQVELFGSALLQHLRSARQRRQDITAEEMKAVMEERDRGVARYKRLEQELTQEREESANKEDLLMLQRERDRAMSDIHQLEAELQTLRANTSSLDLAVAPPSDSPEAPPLVVQLQQLSQEKQSMEAELLRCQGAEQDAGERIRRLERLVDVLRKKVGTGSVRAVI